MSRVLKHLSGKKEGQYILYWMQQSHRISGNHALNFAASLANERHCPLVVYFGLTQDYPEANLRHYQFMLEGIMDVREKLGTQGIPMVCHMESPEQGIFKLASKAQVLVMDKGYLRIQRQWRLHVISSIKKIMPMDVYEVDSDLIVPVEKASDHLEYAARTIRPKLWRFYQANKSQEEVMWKDLFTIPKVDYSWTQSQLQNAIQNLELVEFGDHLLNQKELEKFLVNLKINHDILPSPIYHGGESQAQKVWQRFIEGDLWQYHEDTPVNRHTSRMSMYLHFGQISSLKMLKDIEAKISHYEEEKIPYPKEAIEAYVEQLFIRRELAYNFAYYEPNYDRFDKMTYGWAYETMAQHRNDPREYLYSYEEFVQAKTHDRYWNEAMQEMVETGYMHNYMRMYWCKKIIEWTPTFERAYEIAIRLNNTYFIDGRDANAYTGVAWCFGRHDHGWKEREVFGKLRYMNANGLKRKFGM